MKCRISERDCTPDNEGLVGSKSSGGSKLLSRGACAVCRLGFDAFALVSMSAHGTTQRSGAE